MARTLGTRSLMPRDVNAAARAAQVMQLRIGGMSEREIAERVGLSQSRVSRIIKGALATQRKADSDELRALEAERVDALHRAMWPKALHGDTGAAGVVLRASERRSRLLALDAGGEGGSGSAGGAGMVVTVWLQAFVLDGPEAMRAVYEEAQAVGLQAAQAQAPDARPEGVMTHLLWLHSTNGPYPVDTATYRNMIAAIARGEDVIGV